MLTLTTQQKNTLQKLLARATPEEQDERDALYAALNASEPLAGVHSLIGKAVWLESTVPVPQVDERGRPAGVIFPLTAGELREIDGPWLTVLVFNNPNKPEAGGVVQFITRDAVRSIREAPKPESAIATGAGRILTIPGRGA